ncbi:hypothetical protein MPSEU_000858500 [Mayamaea pseudoterrestris]|nr:hypothetical protein MPSEU_000858500 [Mayamaea pseudoterrestris]
MNNDDAIAENIQLEGLIVMHQDDDNEGHDNVAPEAVEQQQPQQQEGPDNIDDDDDEEEHEEEEDEDDDCIEGGIADPDPENKFVGKAKEADITLYLLCTETFDHLYKPDTHPVLKLNQSVRIGLGKATLLEKVMQRYTVICNELRPEGTEAVDVSDLDFIHVQLLKAIDTPEAAALMKNDKIRVLRERRTQRAHDLERLRQQREYDKKFFEQMRGWLAMPKVGKKIALLCRSSDQHDNMQTFDVVRCDEAIVSKRCKWLGALISRQRQYELLRREQNGSRVSNLSEDDDNVQPVYANERLDQERRIERALAIAHIENDNFNGLFFEHSAAAQIENDDEDYYDGEAPSALEVPIPLDVSANAIRLLLEYIYTNRVASFGVDAFTTACRTRPSEKRLEGPVPPFDVERRVRQWPNKGLPLLSFEDCIAAIQLGELASMPRFSLMAEIAASLKLSGRNVVSALTLCEKQRQLSGNPLPRLRKAVMMVLKCHRILNEPSFLDSLNSQGNEMIPSLLSGVVDAVEAEDSADYYKRKKARLDAAPDQWRRQSMAYFPKIDQMERKARDLERSSRRELIDKGRRSSRFTEARSRNHGLKRSARRIAPDVGNQVIAGIRGEGVETRSMEIRASKRRRRV